MSQCAITADGDKEWRNAAGELHREDGPAIERAEGGKSWYRNDRCHREDGPAIEHTNGDKEWRLNGQLHREDGPAMERADGYKAWYRNGQCHRENGPAVEYANGDKMWYQNGQRHREDGPAIEHSNGDKHWFRNGQKHREDGSAVERANGTREWWIADLKITQAQFDALPRDADGRLHSDTGPLVETEKSRCWFWHGEHVTEMTFEAHCTAQRVMQGLGDVMENLAPQRPRRRPAEHQRRI